MSVTKDGNEGRDGRDGIDERFGVIQRGLLVMAPASAGDQRAHCRTELLKMG